MFTRLKWRSLTSRWASQCVGDDRRYITMTGTPAIAHSSVAVPDDDSATSAPASASPRSWGTMGTNDCAPCITDSSSDDEIVGDRMSTRLNSSHGSISYAVFCLKKKKK